MSRVTAGSNAKNDMPNMTGIEFLRALRAGGDQTPFGFVTSEGSEDMAEVAQNAGARFVIVKPFTPKDGATIREYLHSPAQ